MTTFTSGGVSIYYEKSGSGFPLLLLAPGGLNSTIDAWARAAINPLISYADDFRLIAMDQRNAGRSTGPFDLEDPWGSFIDDQLGLLNHLGVDRFLVMGCCIGCSYALKLAERVPERLAGAVLEQPIGLTEENRATWLTNRRTWATGLTGARADLSEADGERFGSRMFDDAEFVGSVPREFARSCRTPLLVLPGIDAIHPNETGREIGDLCPGATVVEPWKDAPESTERATAQVRSFLQEHAL